MAGKVEANIRRRAIRRAEIERANLPLKYCCKLLSANEFIDLHIFQRPLLLVAVEAIARAKDFQALPQLLGALDDPYLVNRQFAYKGLQEMLGMRLSDFGYRIHLTSKERRKPLDDLRARFSQRPQPNE